MADAAAVDVLNSANYLLKELNRLHLLELLALNDVIEELASAGVLHNKEQLPRSFDYLIRLNKEVSYRIVGQLTSYSWITFGCLTFLRMLISRVTLSTSPLSLMRSFSRILMATFSPEIVCVPILTFPKVPEPSDLPRREETKGVSRKQYEINLKSHPPL